MVSQYQNTQLVKEVCLITWNVIVGHQSSHSGCGGHVGGKDEVY